MHDCVLPPLPSIEILGIRIHVVDQAATLDRIAGFIEEGQPHHVVTVNPEFVEAARTDAAFRQVLERADLCVADGVGLLMASRWQGRPLPERVTGTDSVVRIAERSAHAGWRLFFLGAAPGVAERAAGRLQARFPGMVVAGTHPGSPDPEEEDEIVQRVRNARPDILFVAWGAPRQDLWIARHLDRLGVPACMGVGGAFDFHAGIVRRAPLLVQRAGMEWLFRLGLQPQRWRRMLALPRFAVRAAAEAWQIRRAR
ncbi:MAG: WecB/TagA/CpsF family glycosyltransferase [Deltaproteobacteria bacterium]|nr:WecB/TagA/CpsF family glycosyltransferase [Deltaproteobacteria bacterium]